MTAVLAGLSVRHSCLRVYLDDAAGCFRRSLASGRSDRVYRSDRDPDRGRHGRGRGVGLVQRRAPRWLRAHHGAKPPMCRTDRCCTRRPASRSTSGPERRCGDWSAEPDRGPFRGGCRHPDSGWGACRRGTGSGEGPIAGTGAELGVNVNPHAYRDLAQRHLAGLELI
jgi:hypothetical protein